MTCHPQSDPQRRRETLDKAVRASLAGDPDRLWNTRGQVYPAYSGQEMHGPVSITLMSAVWDKAPVSGAELLLLLAMADHANDEGYLHPTPIALAKKARVARETAWRAISRFEKVGLLVRVGVTDRGLPAWQMHIDALPRLDKSVTTDHATVISDHAAVTTDHVTTDHGVTSDHGERDERSHRARSLSGNRQGTVRGSRARPAPIPDDFGLTDDMRAWAKSKGVLGNLARETERFADYWKGSGKTKADWVATWRNWISREADDPRSQTIRRSISSAYNDDHVQTEDERLKEWEAEKRRMAADAKRNDGIPELFASPDPVYGGVA